jgi:hypothetical protein
LGTYTKSRFCHASLPLAGAIDRKLDQRRHFRWNMLGTSRRCAHDAVAASVTRHAMQFYTDTELSPRQSLTPEGFLICSDVPVARIGTQFYHPTEIPDLDDDGRGYIAVQRDER